MTALGVTVTIDHTTQNGVDYNSLVTAVPGNTQLVFLPWQVASNAQTFFDTMRANNKNAIIMGSDGTDDPGQFHGAGSYVSGFPVAVHSAILTSFTNAHSGQPELFGLPTYTAVWANATAIQRACAGHSTTTRAAINAKLPNVTIPIAKSVLGFKVRFLHANAGLFQGPGDMGGKAAFGIYKILNNGSYKRVH